MNQSLTSYNVLVTRPKHQAEDLCRLIEQQGWRGIKFPTLDIVAEKNSRITPAFDQIKNYHWLIFISINAVNFALSANNGKIDCFKHTFIAAVGKSTAKALLDTGLEVDLLPENQFNTEGLLATTAMNDVKGKPCLIVRGKGGRETLAKTLRERGAIVDYMEVYVRKIPAYDDSDVVQLLQQDRLDAITITSGEALKNLMIMIKQPLHQQLFVVPLIVISHRIKVLAENMGFKTIAITDNPGDTAIIETVVKLKN